jgi:hypothetical protein
MQYFKVKPYATGIPMGNKWFLVANELITEKEAIKRNWNLDKLKEHSTIIDVNRNETYWYFGTRRMKVTPENIKNAGNEN